MITTCAPRFCHADISNHLIFAVCIQRLGNLEGDTADRDSKEILCLPIQERYIDLIQSAKSKGE